MFLENNSINKILSSNKSFKDLESTTCSIEKVFQQLFVHKENVRKDIENDSRPVLLNLDSSDTCIAEGKNLLKNTDEVLKKIHDESDLVLKEATEELAFFSNELTEALLGLEVATRIAKIHKTFNLIDEANAAKNYSLVLDILNKLEQLINVEENQAVDKVFQKCQCYESIHTKYHVQSHLLKQNLHQKFENLVQLKEKSFQTSKSIAIHVSKDEEKLDEIIHTLHKFEYDWDTFCKFLMENCLEPILRKPVAIEIFEENENYMELRLSYSIKNRNDFLRPSYKQVFQNLTTFFKTLQRINVKLNKNQQFFGIIAEHIAKDFWPVFLEDCLALAVPETLEEYKESSLISDLKDFEKFLHTIGLISTEENLHIAEFCKNYSAKFKERFQNNLFNITKEVATKDLQDMIPSSQLYENETSGEEIYPVCMISKSIMELVQVFKHLIRNPNIIAEWEEEDFLLKTVVAVLDKYTKQVAMSNKKLLESIPQQAALFYNNCMILIHWLHKVIQKNFSMFETSLNEIECNGKQYLEKQVTGQKNIIKDILKEFELAEDLSLGQQPLKLVRQCMRQLEILRNVWQNVLTTETYNPIFCEMLETICKDLVKRIMSVEDISASLANDLSSLIDIVLQKAPLLFDDKHMVLHIKSWAKLEQLKLILNASLQEIVDLWCNGVGPLTLNFKAEEVRFLIRALFQNTDRRANAIAKIV